MLVPPGVTTTDTIIATGLVSPLTKEGLNPSETFSQCQNLFVNGPFSVNVLVQFVKNFL